MSPDPDDRQISVAFRNLTKTYQSSSGNVQALTDISLNIAKGDIFGIIGRSGAGKSSLLRMINRLEIPSSGQVLANGKDVGTLNEHELLNLRRRIGMIFQHFNLLSSKTVRDNVGLPLRVAGVPRDQIRKRVDEVLALVGLEEKHAVYPSRLSGGQKQRVGIARALVHNPEILLCDEATSALDPETTLSILHLLRDINAKLGLTVILITHEMSVIREICKNVLVLDNGHAVETGPVWQVFGDARHDATRALLDPEGRAIPADIAQRLQPTPLDHGYAIVELNYTGAGNAQPDLAGLNAHFGLPIKLLNASLDRIQGHTQGRMLIALPANTREKIASLSPDSATAKVLGYVPDYD